MGSHKLLLIEDEPVVSVAEAKLLRENGYPTTTAATGEEGLTALAENRTIDMLIVDIELGEGIDGVETARRALLIRPLPVLFLTGHADSETVAYAATVPHYGYVEKNTSDHVLLQTIEMAYRLHYAHRQTRREKENLRATLDSVSDAVLVTDRMGRVVSCNSGVHSQFGYDVDDFIGQWCVSLAPTNQRRVHWQAFEQALEEGSSTLEGFCMHRDRRMIPVEASFQVRVDVDGRPMGCVEVVRNLTPRREYEAKLTEQREELGRLARHLQRVREEQTAFIAREVHDELGQSLSSMEMHLTVLEEALRVDNTEAARREADEVREILARTVEASRNLVEELRPTVLDQSGLTEALRALVSGYNDRPNQTVTFDADPRAAVRPRADSEESLAVYRIVQEALTNAVRHSGATKIAVRIEADDGELDVSVSDNGVGFDSEGTSRSHGILGMRERALSCGCLLELSSAPGEGTTVRVRVGTGDAP